MRERSGDYLKGEREREGSRFEGNRQEVLISGFQSQQTNKQTNRERKSDGGYLKGQREREREGGCVKC